MSKTILSVALLASAALALPAVEVVQVRQIEKRQDSSADLSAMFPTDVDVSDLASLLPTGLAIPTDLDLSSIIGGIATLLPSGCQLPSALGSVPTPPADVQSAILSYTDVCHEPSFTGSVGAHYSSYVSAAESWYSANGDDLTKWASDFVTACPYASDIPMGPDAISNLLSSYSVTIPSCAATSTGAKQTGSSSAKQTGSAAAGAASSAASGTAASGTAGTQGSGASGSPSSPNNTGAAPQQTAFAAVAGVVAGFVGVVAYL